MTRLNHIPTPDNYVWPQRAGITDAYVDNGHVTTLWSDGNESRFHAMWLRDNCACPQCTHPSSLEQRIDLLDIPNGIAVQACAVDAGALKVVFTPGGHVSYYNPGWLYAHSGLAAETRRSPFFWTARDLEEPPTFDGPAAMSDDDTLYDVLSSVVTCGLARVRGLSTEENTVEQFAYRIGPIRESHFERIFNVISRPDTDSNAYTSFALPVHTDMPTRETPHGLQLLHCLVAEAKGGESVMVDGFRVAEDLRTESPEDFERLASVKWTYANRAGDTDYRWAAPHIVLDDSGRISELRLASFSRAPLLVPFDQVEGNYRALRLFLEMTYRSRYRMVYDFRPGDLVVFDNRRILHGRNAFDPHTGGRHLQGTYVDRDDMLSTLRMIEHRRDLTGDQTQ